MYYLLGTQIIVDLARGSDNPAARWIRHMDGRISPSDLKVSAMSWAAIEIEFKSRARRPGGLTPSQKILQERIHRVFERYRALGSILSVSFKAIQVWVNYLQDEIQYSDPDGNLRLVGFEEKMLLATAIAGIEDDPVTLVAKRELVHSQLSVLGLKIDDPYGR